MSKLRDLHVEWMNDPAYKEAYDALSTEFDLAQKLIEARTQAGLTQEDLAKRLKTTASVIARLESGHQQPTLRTLEKFAHATGRRLTIQLER